jgi:hypothetical protein
VRHAAVPRAWRTQPSTRHCASRITSADRDSLPLARSFDDVRKQWGGGVMGVKSQAKTRAKERLIEKELRQRAA